MTTKTNDQKILKFFFIIMALNGLALGLSDSLFSVYFSESYMIDAFQRGLIEIPRETPGIFIVLIISVLSFWGNLKLAIFANILSAVSILILGIFTPLTMPFNIMLIFLFINSVGMHMFMPVGDSLTLSVASKGSLGSIMGKFRGTGTAFGMIAAILVFFGFRFNVFSFAPDAPIRWPFIISGAAFIGVIIMLCLVKRIGKDLSKTSKTKFIIRKEYTLFYIIAMLFGVRKQIMFVFGPWVLIELLGFGADTLAILSIVGAAIGIFFIPAVGKWIDKFGTGKVMAFEAAAFIVVFTAYGILSAGLAPGGFIANVTALILFFVFALKTLDIMSIQFGLVRSVYLRTIALHEDEVAPTLALGMSLDHILTIVSAVFCGWLWTTFGPMYVFFFAALLAVGNMIVARKISKNEKKVA